MKRSRRGTALIEFAGSLVLLSTVFTGVFQLGHSFYLYNRLVNAVRQGARFASLQPDAAQASAAVRKMVVYGDPNPQPNAQPLVEGLEVRNVQVVISGNQATIFIRDFAIRGLFANIPLNGKPTVTFPIMMGGSK